MPTPKYYLLDENKNLVEGYDKEGFLALLQQAIEQGTLENIDPDSAVASKLRSILNGKAYHVEFVTEAQFNELKTQGQLQGLTYYFITDDTTGEDLETLNTKVNALIERVTGIENFDLWANEAIQAHEDRLDTIETKKIYEHDIMIYGEGISSGSVSNHYQASFRITTNEATPTINADIDVILELLYQLYEGNVVPASGYRFTLADSSIFPCIGIKPESTETYINLVTGVNQSQISFMQFNKSTIKKVYVNTRRIL